MQSLKRSASFFLTAGLLLLAGCAGLYFRDAGRPPSPPPGYTLATLPFSEYWTGIVFNGAKVGFSRFSLARSNQNPGLYEIRAEAALHFRFLLFEKKVVLRSVDTVAEDLSLVAFAYDYDLDGNAMKITGELGPGGIEVKIATRGQETQDTLSLAERTYPASVISLYPVLHGLKVGARHEYPVFSGETQTIEKVKQKIEAYEESDLFRGKAFKVSTEFLGQAVNTWIDQSGLPLLEISMNGVVIAALESEREAKRYIAQATLNKQDVLLDFSLIRPDVPIPEPESLKRMEVLLGGISEGFALPDDDIQRCIRMGEEVLCTIETPSLDEGREKRDDLHFQAEAAKYLRSSYTVPSTAEPVRETARLIAGESAPTADRVHTLVEWIQANVEKAPVDAFTALDVLARKKGECQGHTYLYAAFARALEIPTRVVNGIVYSRDHGGFLYHTWAESLVGGRWIPVDPTLDQVPADATHIKLIEGETLQELAPLATLVGRIRLKIVTTGE